MMTTSGIGSIGLVLITTRDSGLAGCVNPFAKITASPRGYGFQTAQWQCVDDACRPTGRSVCCNTSATPHVCGTNATQHPDARPSEMFFRQQVWSRVPRSRVRSEKAAMAGGF